jgi:hypothetical protein
MTAGSLGKGEVSDHDCVMSKVEPSGREREREREFEGRYPIMGVQGVAGSTCGMTKSVRVAVAQGERLVAADSVRVRDPVPQCCVFVRGGLPALEGCVGSRARVCVLFVGV